MSRRQLAKINMALDMKAKKEKEAIKGK